MTSVWAKGDQAQRRWQQLEELFTSERTYVKSQPAKKRKQGNLRSLSLFF
jgi:hypothetical protein